MESRWRLLLKRVSFLHNWHQTAAGSVGSEDSKPHARHLRARIIRSALAERHRLHAPQHQDHQGQQ
ncbi:hypothetical protein IRJ41_000870 [Triplophysa rosa]|uniref:Uncharacterized protein n=1 Tax=Triplophysa rosa TaxID=992332 RepID=A0A9W7WU63_TRIRA|nr:hypothetical protein IRJ41_000870 [Triplophysa rosa]